MFILFETLSILINKEMHEGPKPFTVNHTKTCSSQLVPRGTPGSMQYIPVGIELTHVVVQDLILG